MDNRRNLLSTVAFIARELIDSSSSSESDNEEFEILERANRKRNVPRVQNYVEQIVPALTDQEFKNHFRISRETFDYLLFVIEPKLQRQKTGSPMISPRKQFLLALWRLATPDSFRSICERFNVGSTALYVTRRVIDALVEFAPIVIKWPTEERVTEIWTGFETKSSFPKIIGVIDGTHINIPAPIDNPKAYVNRIGRHSIHLQAICDHNCQFIHCYTGHVGSVHDQRVLRLSEVQTYLGDESKFPEDCHLIREQAYKLHDNLLIPYKDNGHLTEHQKNYNFCLASARTAIERAFGLLKGRFRSLLTVLAMERIDLIPKHILACCVLHNVCLIRNDDLHVEINEETINNMENYIENPCDVVHVGLNIRHTGEAKRDLISARLRMRNVRDT